MNQYSEWFSWNLSAQLKILWSTPKLWRCLWLASVNEFCFFFLLCFWFIILPWVSVSFSLYVLLASFPPCVSSPHSLYHFFCLSCSKSPLFTFVLPWTDLEKPNSSDPWYPVLPPAFPREWTNLMINPVSLIAHTIWQTHTHTKLSSCLPANYHTTSPTPLPVPTPHLCDSML